MRDAVIAYARGECDMPMPMHLEIPELRAEIQMKSSYRRGGRYFALKMAATFPGNAERGVAVGNGMMLLASAETGEPAAFLDDGGYLTGVRTAAVAAMVARELGRRDRAVGILGCGLQARLSAESHARMLPAARIVIWGRARERAEACARDVRAAAPGVEMEVAETPAEVARACRLILTCTASRGPLLYAPEIEPGTLILAVGADAAGKQELEPAILRRAGLMLADSREQCEKFGELQHAPDLWGRAVEIGDYCRNPRPAAPGAITVCDFTGLGAEDLYIAEYVYEKAAGAARYSDGV